MPYSKGPWKRRTGIWSHQFETSEGDTVGEASGLYRSRAEADANAALLTAAPELLEALRAALQALELLHHLCKTPTEIDISAIAQLEGVRAVQKAGGNV